ncbi:phosphatase PAP2 family protein [Natronorubrum sulfidifaciens]|uniref:PA-phosphatase-like phosphoesterase n=1 Tax=Natronorubrum sulfidifaciens JCM 14089 TaxID=1230460 RepID=L9W2I6_9EURY|nr:phosphatase PAP2 family protein [Natronorubrum sulfidifaciens]ELY42518.1 PA-phosphatase-like phosphoesterase [Natronorubrum sulfidifaciens JCM 14089]
MWFDPAVIEAVRDAVPTWLGIIMVVLSYLGSVYLIAPAMIAAYWTNRDRVAPWLGGVIGCYGLMSLTKSYHTATRPTVDPPVSADAFPTWFVPWYEHAAHISTTSFPSGHTMAATIIVGMIALELPRSTLRNRALVGITLIGWVGFTRVGLGVHYPGDVAGGFIYGVGFLGSYYLLRNVVSRRLPVDETTATFAIGLSFGVLATVFVGSRNSLIVFGGGLGGLLAWYSAPTISEAMRHATLRVLLPTLGAVLAVGVWLVAGEVSNGVVVVWSALSLAVVVLVPWSVPTRRCWLSAKRYSRRLAR